MTKKAEKPTPTPAQILAELDEKVRGLVVEAGKECASAIGRGWSSYEDPRHAATLRNAVRVCIEGGIVAPSARGAELVTESAKPLILWKSDTGVLTDERGRVAPKKFQK